MLDISVKLDDGEVQANIQQPHQRFLLVETRPGVAAGSGGGEVHLNLALILDKSGSMMGSPIEQVKQAAQNIVQLLSREDRLTLVVFNHEADMVIKSEPLSKKNDIIKKIGQITSDGGTAIDKGMDMALGQMEKVNLKEYVNRAIVLTDGVNEHGNDSRCIELARDAADKGIPFSAFGFGVNWSPDLLEQVGDAGKGRMVHIGNSNDVVSLFEEEVRSASATAAKNVRFCLDCVDATIPGLRLAEINAAYVIKPQIAPVTPIKKGGGIWEFPVGDVSFDLPKSLLIQLFFPPVNEGYCNCGELYGLYDLPAKRSSNLKSGSCGIGIKGVAHHRPSVDSEVRDCIARLQIYVQQHLAEQLEGQGKTGEAVTILQDAARTALQTGQKELATILQNNATTLQSGKEITKEERIKTILQSKTTLQKGGK